MQTQMTSLSKFTLYNDLRALIEGKLMNAPLKSAQPITFSSFASSSSQQWNTKNERSIRLLFLASP